MKTFYFYGKSLRHGFHIKVSLYNQAPENYYALTIANGKNEGDAWHNLLSSIGWKPPVNYAIIKRMKI